MMARPVTQNIRRQRAQAVATRIAGLSISARKLSPVADVYFTARGRRTDYGFYRQDRGSRFADGGAVEFPTARTSAFSQVTRRS